MPCVRFALDNNSLTSSQDNDAWESHGSGKGASKAEVTFAPGERAIECRRAPSKCRGTFACDQMDPAFRTTVRFELDPASRKGLLEAQADTRRTEGTTPEQNVALCVCRTSLKMFVKDISRFKRVISNSRCNAIDSRGNRCNGGPIMKHKPQVRFNFPSSDPC